MKLKMQDHFRVHTPPLCGVIQNQGQGQEYGQLHVISSSETSTDAAPSTDEEEYDTEGGDDVNMDHTFGGLIKDPIPVSSPEEDLNDEGIMQPVDENSGSPKEPGIAFGRASQADQRTGRLAQLVKAPLLHIGGRWFEPNTAHCLGPISNLIVRK